MSDPGSTVGRARVDESESVSLEMPASTEHLRLVRLLVSSFATSHGADLNDLEDLRLAAVEVCAHAISATMAGDRLRITAAVSPEVDGGPMLVVRASVAEGGDPGPLDELSSMVLDAAANAYGVDVEQGTVSVWFRRTVRSAGPVDHAVD